MDNKTYELIMRLLKEEWIVISKDKELSDRQKYERLQVVITMGERLKERREKDGGIEER